MQTLKQFLQNLSYKKDKTIAREAKALLLALKQSKVPEKLTFYIVESEELKKCRGCESKEDLEHLLLCSKCQAKTYIAM